MAAGICLVWIGLQLEAPWWYFAALIAGFIIKYLDE